MATNNGPRGQKHKNFVPVHVSGRSNSSPSRAHEVTLRASDIVLLGRVKEGHASGFVTFVPGLTETPEHFLDS